MVRSKADVEHHRDVTRERRLEDVDGGLLILEEAIDLPLREELPTVVEVIVDCDLHGAVPALSQGKNSPQPPSKVACAKFRSQLLVECHSLDNSPQRKS